jgi:hypothetical protein
LPVHAALFGVGLVGLDPDLSLQQRQFADAAVAQALARQATQLAFGNVQRTAVFERVAKIDPFDIRPRLLGWERRVERPLRVCVEVVAHERHLLASEITRVQQLGHFDRPVDLSGPYSQLTVELRWRLV